MRQICLPKPHNTVRSIQERGTKYATGQQAVRKNHVVLYIDLKDARSVY